MTKVTFTCPHCKKVATKVRYEKFHGDKCSAWQMNKVRSKAPITAIDINKYTELHEELLNAIGEYYNHHIAFSNKPSKWSLKYIVTDLLNINRAVKKIRENNLSNRPLLVAEYAERKKKLTEKKVRKQNGNNSSN